MCAATEGGFDRGKKTRRAGSRPWMQKVLPKGRAFCCGAWGGKEIGGAQDGKQTDSQPVVGIGEGIAGELSFAHSKLREIYMTSL